MARGPKKHLKKINTPKSWLFSKMDGIYCVLPSVLSLIYIYFTLDLKIYNRMKV